ncbi:gamma-glutamylcyclotransferase [bacterium]|nr:gamma-glutamylcyclotransferase [bacterium]
MINIFGYGSLINPDSIASTLGRKVITRPAILEGYYRSWTASVDIHIHNTIKKGLFLDLTRAKGAFCNGVLFEVHEHELQYLDCRESGYEKRDIDVDIYENNLKAVTYCIPDSNKSSSGVVCTKYKAIVEEGLSRQNKAFKQTYLATTENYDGEYMKGKYSF